jgi:PAS domain S-box-containing protein
MPKAVPQTAILPEVARLRFAQAVENARRKRSIDMYPTSVPGLSPSDSVRILLLEDSPTDAELCIRFLKRADLKVEIDVARDSQEFMESLNNKAYDVVLTDFRLPSWTGLDALRALRTSGRDTPVILVTGTLGDERAIECIKAGVSDYVLKQNLERLPPAIHRALEEYQLRQSRDRAQRELAESEKQYRLLFDANPNPMWVFDRLTLRFLTVNDAAVRHYGYSLDEFLSMTVRDIRPQEEVDRFLAAVGSDHTRLSTRELWKHRKKDGTIIDVEITSQTITFRTVEAELVLAQDVTEQKRTQEALRRSEEDHRMLFEQTPDGIFVADALGHYQDVNPAGVELLGYSRDEIRGLTITDVVAAEEVERIAPEVARLEAGGLVATEWRFKRKNGSHFDGALLARQMFDGRLLGILRDITERKKSEEQLREYARVVEGLEEMILVVDREYCYIIANRAFLNFRGMSAEQVVGRPAGEVVGEDVFATQVKDKMDECFQGNVVQYEMTYDFPNMGKRDLHVSYFPIQSQGGVDRIACVLQDITERKLSQEALRKSEERFSKAFRNNPLAISISTAAEGRYLDVNDAFLNFLGYQRKEVIGRTAAELRFWSEPLDHLEMLQQLKEEKQVARREMRFRTTKGEEREAEVWAESIELDGQRCLLAITRDITEIQQLEAQFRQAQKMEAVGRLAGGVAHDFNNILGIIMGYSDISLGLIASDSPVGRYVSETKKAAQRATLLTRQLLAFSRKQVNFPKILDLNEVVHNVTSMFLRLVGEDIKVEFRPGASIGSIKADPGQIEQILMNLVVNARDAMPDGGKIIIETGQAELEEPYVSHHPGANVGKHVVLMVSDTGCGMDEATKSKIFEPFFTTKGVGKGTGLGLSTVYGIVKQSEGYIMVYSEPDKGTTFKIYFPRLSEKAEALIPSDEEADPPRGSETILVVEDDTTLRELTSKLLQEGGYNVVEARDAEDALEKLAASEPQIDLLLTDVVMPGRNGVDLLAQAKLVRPNLRAVFMSGYTGDLVARHGVLLNQNSFLEKPFTKRALLAKVYAALHSGEK